MARTVLDRVIDALQGPNPYQPVVEFLIWISFFYIYFYFIIYACSGKVDEFFALPSTRLIAPLDVVGFCYMYLRY